MTVNAHTAELYGRYDAGATIANRRRDLNRVERAAISAVTTVCDLPLGPA
ncbi:MAG: hypothetical protein AB7Q17_02660 [Phycisphaerae bacterium]